MASVRDHWRSWRALPWRERVRLLQLAILLPLLHASLITAGYARTRRWCARLGDGAAQRTATERDIADAQRLARLADIAGRHGLVRATCLRQALVVMTLLCRRGLDARLQLGVQQTGEPFGAHAWVVLDGTALVDGTNAHHLLGVAPQYPPGDPPGPTTSR